MNLWTCDYPGCGVTACGVSGAIGLRAVGWQFVPQGLSHPAAPPKTYCPWHRTDLRPVKCSQGCAGEDRRGCRMCAAIQDANRFQLMIAQAVLA